MNVSATGQAGRAQLAANNRQPGINNLEIELDNREDASAVAERLASQASCSLLLHTETLEPAITTGQLFWMRSAGWRARKPAHTSGSRSRIHIRPYAQDTG